MRAVIVEGAGETARLTLGEVPRPSVESGQVLIRVAAASVNRPDVQQRRGLYPPPPDASPILGLDVSGTVAAAADDVAWPTVGTRVCALVNGGGYAEYCSVPAGQCLPIPANLGFVEAASLPEAFFTAWNALMLMGRLDEGERLLLQGGSSGVGLAATQIAVKICKASVIATASTADKRAMCLSMGAVEAIDYRDDDWPEQVRERFPSGCDVIVDAQAGPTSQRQLDLLANGGRLVLLASHAGSTGEIDTRSLVRRHLTITGSTLRPHSARWKAELATMLRNAVWPLIEQSLIKTHICATFPLERAEEAHTLMQANQQLGKIVLIVDPAASPDSGAS